MIKWLKKLNRTRNHHFKKYKFKLKLTMLSIFSLRVFTRKIERATKTNKIAIPFIGKGIGDAIVISGLVDTLANNGFEVSVIADKKLYFLFTNWRNISKLVFFDSSNEEETITELKGLGDFIFIDPHEITSSTIHTFNIIKGSKPIKTIGFNKSFKIYDVLLEASQPLGHISNKCIDVLRYLNIDTTTYDYVVRIPESDKNEASEYIHKIGDKKLVIFNPYGGVEARFFSTEQISAILNCLAEYADKIHVIIIGEKNRLKGINVGGNISKNPYPSFFTAAQMIKECHLVITPDTSIVHLSRVFNKRMLCFYPLKHLSNGEDNADVWSPNYNNAVQIRLSEENLQDASIDGLIGHIRNEINSIIGAGNEFYRG
ncbi:TPA: glycosyltransferase family 9 protein [Enterobacter cloacae]